MTTTLHFDGDLSGLLRRRWKDKRSIAFSLDRRTSIKDLLESFGLPHTEVGAIEREGQELDFSHIVREGSTYTIKPVPVPWDVSVPTLLRPEPLPCVSFIVDVNVGRLARYLRAAGLDTLYDHQWSDRDLAQLVRQERRMLLTRDMGLLMRKQVVFGRYIRSAVPVDQLREVIELLGLAGQLDPFSRCLECNFRLQSVAKEEILHRLEPLTRKYYTSFSRCAKCDKIYWPGSHTEKMRRLLAGQLEP
ncbi:MAG: Mut7-C ubiquitin/RNAse domain-containing protein [Desulfobulbaceae bacterium]|nr:Mut7-C ubiquitin/RNAse domain-containing protein [Desulfobulbaceae bacterium]